MSYSLVQTARSPRHSVRSRRTLFKHSAPVPFFSRTTSCSSASSRRTAKVFVGGGMSPGRHDMLVASPTNECCQGYLERYHCPQHANALGVKILRLPSNCCRTHLYHWNYKGTANSAYYRRFAYLRKAVHQHFNRKCGYNPEIYNHNFISHPCIYDTDNYTRIVSEVINSIY